MTYTLAVCLALSWLGTCAKHIEGEFRTEDQCNKALQELKSQPAFSYGLCQEKKSK